jgi:hypothetical protein
LVRPRAPRSGGRRARPRDPRGRLRPLTALRHLLPLIDVAGTLGRPQRQRGQLAVFEMRYVCFPGGPACP